MTCPLASIINPLSPDEIYLFYLAGGDRFSTGLEIYNYAKEPVNRSLFYDNGIPLQTVDTNTIINPGAYSCLLWNGMLNVYGMIKDPTFNPPGGRNDILITDPKRIAQLSPVFRIIGKQEVAAARGVGLATLVDGKGQGWMYSFSASSTPSTLKIQVIKLGWKESSAPSTISPDFVLSNSHLAAAYDPQQDKNLVIYQAKNGLHITDLGGNDTRIPNTDDARKGTGIALVSYKFDGAIKLYLYYFAGGNGTVQRVIRSEKGAWGSSVALDDGDNPVVSEDSSYLTATLIKDKVVLFYSAVDKPGIFSQEDKIPA